MARTVTLLQVFASSPSDVTPERAQLEDVIAELNKTWAITLGVRLELVQWQTHGRPALGLDAQDVINRQLKDTYDIFIGIMWARFGTPTPRAGSGTEEEFNRALERMRLAGSTKIMFYFKNEPISPLEIDVEQITKVMEFKRRLQREGILYWDFTGPFDDFVRIHLSSELHEWVRSGGIEGTLTESVTKRISDPGSVSSPEENDDDEFGLLDLMAEFQDHIAAALASQTKITGAVERLGTDLTARSAEVTAANASGTVDYRTMRHLADRAAEDLERFVEDMQGEITTFTDEFKSAIHALSYAVAHADELPKSESPNDLRTTLETLQAQIASNVTSTRGFRDTFAESPNLTKRFNKAKRRTESVVDRLIDEMEAQIALIRQLLDSLPSGTQAN